MQTSYATAAVSFTIDNAGNAESFSGTETSVQFLAGKFRNASFAETIGPNSMQFTLDTSGVYAFYNNNVELGSGTITSMLAAATPLPATLPLFAGGLGFVGYLTRRKKRAQAVAA